MDVNRVHLRVPIASVADILTWGQSQVQRVADAAVQVLLRVGFRVEGDTYLTVLQAAGARADQTTNTVRFTEGQILETARQMATSSPAHPRSVIAYDTRDIRVGLGGGANNSFDWESRKAVASRSEHLRNVAHLAVGHPNVVSIAPPVQVKDVPLALEPVMSFALLIRNTPREMSDVSPYIPTQPAHVKWLKCLGEALADRRGGSYWMHNQEYVTSPLMLSSRALDTIEARVQHGCDAIACGSMAIAGLSAPVTIAGAAVAATAEILGALTVVRLLWPRVKLSGIVGSGCLDMATTHVSFANPRVQLQNFACVELFRRGFGCDISALTCYRDANEPGMQACYEYAFLSLLFHSVTGPHYFEPGMLANGNLFSPEQAILDIHMMGEVQELFGGFECTDAALGLNVLEDAGLQHRGILEHPHTLGHFHEVLPLTGFWPRGMTAAAGHDAFQTDALLERAHQSVLEAIATGSRIEPDTEFNAEVDEIVRDAAVDMGMGEYP
jgi:trimethylamine--corrinoid protein Co-methyltransferase